MDNSMEYTSNKGIFTYTITNNTDYAFEPIDYEIIKSAFNRWDDIIAINSRFGDAYTITVSFTVETLEPGTLGQARVQTVHYNDSKTFGNTMPLNAEITMNASQLYRMKTTLRSDGKTSYYYVLLHEIGHILGIGTFWNLPGAPKVSYTDNGTIKYYYTGLNALREYRSYFPENGSEQFLGIPVEDDGESGTARVHPEEGVEGTVSANNRYINGIFYPGLNAELMTGWLDNSPTPILLSRITLGFLEDIGYKVNYNLADVYI
jgi:hypothetical protein